MEKPNILLIFTDQQRFDAIGAAGNSIIKTPNLDKLAEEGDMFSNCMTPAPLCQPARACLVSGRSASSIGCLENNIPTNFDVNKALPKQLHDNGYYCQAIGKMHFSNEPYKVNYGMDNMILSEETRGVRLAKNKNDIVFDDYDRFLMDNHVWGWDKPPEIGYNEIKPLLTPLERQYHVTQWCGDQTVRFLQSIKDKKDPFFLWTSFVKPHVPYDCPRHLKDMYNPNHMPQPFLSTNDGTRNNQYIQDYREKNEFNLYSEHARNLSLSYYYANISFIDEQIGRILDTLEKIGKKDNTIIIFTSDHGDLMGDHGLFYKCFGFEGSMHVPLIIRYPGFSKVGRKRNDLVSLLDLYPTILKAAGLSVEDEDIPGHNLYEKDADHEYVFSEIRYYPLYMCHVRTKKWKYLFYQNGGVESLYDLENDPNELNDLSSYDKYHSILKEMKAKAEDYLRRYGGKDGILDEEGHLIMNSYCSEELSYNPYSRMPWDCRIPFSKVKNDNKRTTFWAKNEDWSDKLR